MAWKTVHTEFDDTMIPWLGRTMKMIDGCIAERLHAHAFDLSKQQWVLLKCLDEVGRMSQCDLAFLTNRDKASLTRLIQTMEKKGLVERRTAKNDGRVNLVRTTRKGAAIFRATVPIMRELIAELQRGLTDVQQRETRKALDIIRANILAQQEYQTVNAHEA